MEYAGIVAGFSTSKEQSVVGNLHYVVMQAQDSIADVSDYLTEAAVALPPDCLKESTYRADLDAAQEKVREAFLLLRGVLDEILKTGM